MLTACGSGDADYDASGVFECTEVIAPAKANDELLTFAVEEERQVRQGESLGLVDTLQLSLKRRRPFFASVFVLVVSSMGLIVSNYSDTTQQAALVMFFFLIIFVLMSGLITPVSSMPGWARAITCVNPLRYFLEAIRALYIKGSSVRELVPQLSALLVYAVVLWLWAIRSYRKNS